MKVGLADTRGDLFCLKDLSSKIALSITSLNLMFKCIDFLDEIMTPQKVVGQFYRYT